MNFQSIASIAGILTMQNYIKENAIHCMQRITKLRNYICYYYLIITQAMYYLTSFELRFISAWHGVSSLWSTTRWKPWTKPWPEEIRRITVSFRLIRSFYRNEHFHFILMLLIMKAIQVKNRKEMNFSLISWYIRLSYNNVK